MFNEKLYYIGLAILGLAGPFLFPDYTMQIAVLCVAPGSTPTDEPSGAVVPAVYLLIDIFNPPKMYL